MLSKKHYENIAKFIKISKTKEELRDLLIGYLKNDNPRFDEQRFIKATK